MNEEDWYSKQIERFVVTGAGMEEDEIVRKYNPESIIKYFTKGRTLLLGSSKGQWINELKARNNEIVIVDFPEIVEILKDKPKRAENCTLIGANIDTDPPDFDQGFDLIIMDNVLEHLLYDFQCIKNIYSWLNKGGRALIVVPFHEVREEDIFHVRSYNLLELERLLEIAGFKVLEAERLEKGNTIVGEKTERSVRSNS